MRIRFALLLIVAGSFSLQVWRASDGLHPGRWWDERFAMANIAAILDGDPKPRNAWYQSLSYWPQAALLAARASTRAPDGSPSLSSRKGPALLPLRTF